MVAYVVVACLLNWIRHQSLFCPNREIINQLFDASLFAGSTVLLMGIFYPPILAEFGDAKLFLLIAGIAGVLYPIFALLPPKK